jgi:hypothetical protein
VIVPAFEEAFYTSTQIERALYALPTWTRTVRLVAEHAELRSVLGDAPSEWACYRFARWGESSRPRAARSTPPTITCCRRETTRRTAGFLAELERFVQEHDILAASSHEDDVVLDPFCGCGTTIEAAEKLKRRWIGIDLTYLAISLIKSRLTAMGSSDYTVLGEPTTADDAADLPPVPEATVHPDQLSLGA